MNNYDIFKEKMNYGMPLIKTGYQSNNCCGAGVSYKAPISMSGSYSMTNDYHDSKDYSKPKGDYK